MLFDVIRERNYTRSRIFEVHDPVARGTTWTCTVPHPEYGPEASSACYPTNPPVPSDVLKKLSEASYSSRTRPDRVLVYGQVPQTWRDNGYDFAEVSSPHSEDGVLGFESKFESGNLRCACRLGESEYELMLSRDLPRSRTTQWFNFRVDGALPGRSYTFHIINFTKSDSLYNHGLQPLCFSQAKHNQTHSGWCRCGEDVAYYKNCWENPCSRGSRHYTLSFTVRTEYAADTLYFSHCYPYTYTQLAKYLNELQSDPMRFPVMNRKTLCTSLGGNRVDLINITQPVNNPRQLEGRKVIMVTARVHPGESNASHVMHGVLDALTDVTATAVYLRERFVFKVVPMMNPDGVIVGNYRNTVAGKDANRLWQSATARDPCVSAVKELLRTAVETRGVELYLDLHGHSNKHNAFVYGIKSNDMKSTTSSQEQNQEEVLSDVLSSSSFPSTSATVNSSINNATNKERKSNNNGASLGGKRAKRKPRQSQKSNGTDTPYANICESMSQAGSSSVPAHIFPYILSKMCDAFSFGDSNFFVPPGKEGTARVVVAREFGVALSYTLEVSFLGPNIGSMKGCHFTQESYRHIGRCVVDAMARISSQQFVDRYLVMASDAQIREEDSDGSDDGNATSSDGGDDDTTIPAPKARAFRKLAGSRESAGGLRTAARAERRPNSALGCRPQNPSQSSYVPLAPAGSRQTTIITSAFSRPPPRFRAATPSLTRDVLKCCKTTQSARLPHKAPDTCSKDRGALEHFVK